MAVYQSLPWHAGELSIHHTLHAPAETPNPTFPGLSAQAIRMLSVAPLLALGTTDASPSHRPWTTIWGGQSGSYAESLGQSFIGIRTPVAGRWDPVVEALVGRDADGEVVSGGEAGRMVSALPVDLVGRKRVKVAGRMVVGTLSRRARDGEEGGEVEDGKGAGEAEIQLVVKIEQSLGNCPKYLNVKRVSPAPARPVLVSDSVHLPPEALTLIANADLFFVSSRNELQDMDTNYRGGPRGFVRAIHTDDEDAPRTLVWPEYSGNRLYQTLGNLAVTPLAGLCFPDFATGDVLYVTGTTEILTGAAAAAVLPRTKLAVQLKITGARFVAQGLPFRGEPGEPSPYNPVVRYLKTEREGATVNDAAANSARLVSQRRLTPSVSRFRFRLREPVRYRAGQYVTLDLAEHMDIGYSHMRDDDPTSLNDDFVRTFTVSSAPSAKPGGGEGSGDDEFEMTIRRVGPVTKFLFKHGLEGNARRGLDLDIDVKGFGGHFTIEQAGQDRVAFVAGGVGITPLLGALPDIDASRIEVLWGVRRDDLGLVLDMLRAHPGIAGSVKLFVTGGSSEQKEVEEIEKAGATVVTRRLKAEDVRDARLEDIKRWYICTSGPMRQGLLEWLVGKETIYEDFNF